MHWLLRRTPAAAMVIVGLAVFLLGVVSWFYSYFLIGLGMLLIAIGGALWPALDGRPSRAPAVLVTTMGALMLGGFAINAAPSDGPVLFFGGLMLLALGVGLLFRDVRRSVARSA